MLLELKNLFQQVVGAFEDPFHLLVPVTVLEALAAAAWTDIVAAHAREIQRLRPAERQARRGGRAGAPGFGRLRRLRRRFLVCGGFLLGHRRKSYPNRANPETRRWASYASPRGQLT